MSTICGLFSKKGSIKKYNTSGLFEKSGIYIHDTALSWQNDSVFMGCHLKKIVPESENETLPFYDPESKLVITADAIIDNRDDLSDLLDLKDDENTPDSTFILEAYKKWGYSCPEYLLGDFAFAIWDDKKQELFCCRDHVAKRLLYFYNSDEFFCFSTLINPIFELKEIEKAPNDIYIADFLSLPSVRHEIDPNITIYKNIYQLHPASCMIISKDTVKKWQYWKIKQTEKIKMKNDREYEQAFIDVFTKAVKCRLRSRKSKGIYLSGGLDSGAIASIAAPILNINGKKLYSFTQVPFSDYKNWLTGKGIADETEYAREYSLFFNNINSYYLSCATLNPLTEIDKTIQIIEQPYKTFENSYWMNEILNQAAGKDVDLLLDGQSGNMTISWGQFDPYIKTLLQHGNIIKSISVIKNKSIIRNTNPHKDFIKAILNLFPYSFKKNIMNLRGSLKDYEELCPINTEFYKFMDQKNRLKKFKIDTYFIYVGNSIEQRLKLINNSSLTHLSCLENKKSMKLGIVRRDPTRDIRVIQFCLNLPEDQYVREGEERRFIRHALKGIIPDKIRLNIKTRGVQGADWCQRIKPIWKVLEEEVNSIGNHNLEKKYLDIKKIKENYKSSLNMEFIRNDIPEIRLVIRSIIFSRFIRNNF